MGFTDQTQQMSEHLYHSMSGDTRDLPGGGSSNSSMTFTESPVHSTPLNNESYRNIDWACVMTNDEPEVVTSHKIYLFSALTLVCIGLIGNSLSILVFSSREMRVMSSNVYLLVLALSDSAYLLTVFLTKLLTTWRCFYFPTVPIDIANRSLVACKLLQYLSDFFADYSTCLILSFTVERFFAVYRPLAFKETFSVRRARWTCLGLLVVIGIIIAPHHIIYMGRPLDLNICSILRDYESHFVVAYIIEMCLFRVIPVFTIAVLNVFIIVNVQRMSKRQRRRHVNGSQRREERNIQMTIMLTVVSTTYIILFLPVLAQFISWKIPSLSESTKMMWQNLSKPLYIAGFATNFFLYTISGRVFREQLIYLLTGHGANMCTRSKPDKEADQGICLVQSTCNGSLLTTDL